MGSFGSTSTNRKIIGPPGFEPGTSSTPRKRATRLRYGPYELEIISTFPAARKPELPLGFEFPRVSGHLSRREAGSEIARVRKHPSPSPRRGSRKGRGRCKGTNGRGQVRGGQPGASSSKLADCSQLNCACPVLLSGLRPG